LALKGMPMANGRDLGANRRSPGDSVPSGASIRVMRGFYEGLEIPVDRDWLVIGRGRTADLVLSEATISRAHAAIGYEKGRFFVQDLGSTNGTGVNGKREPRTTLSDGDEVQLGKLLLQFKLAP
jgi:pSer/pThr/pTyr-binding forkhead associated (FHA) protein